MDEELTSSQEEEMNFKGQTALVVGASRGFGRGIVESLVASGMTVTAVARNRKRLEDLAQDTSATIVVDVGLLGSDAV